MPSTTTISPIETFQKIFPDHRLIAFEDELQYRLRTEDIGKAYEIVADELIREHGLPLVAELEVWKVGGMLREVCLVVKMVPEEVEFRNDE